MGNKAKGDVPNSVAGLSRWSGILCSLLEWLGCGAKTVYQDFQVGIASQFLERFFGLDEASDESGDDGDEEESSSSSRNNNSESLDFAKD